MQFTILPAFSFPCPKTFPCLHILPESAFACAIRGRFSLISKKRLAGKARIADFNGLNLKFALLTVLILPGCTVGPKYQKPAPLVSQPVPAAFTINGVTWKPAAPGANRPRGEWWKDFNDSELNGLEDLAARGKSDAGRQLSPRWPRRANWSTEARSQLFPQISLAPSYVRERTSKNAEASGVAVGTPYNYSLYAVPVSAAWEVDIWGRIRQMTAAARAQMEAAQEDLESLRLLLQSELAQDYFTLRAQDAEIQLLLDTAQAYRKSLDLTINRRKGGVATDLRCLQADTQLRTTEAEIPALRLQRAQVLHAIAALVGQSAVDFQIPELPVQGLPPMQGPGVVPSEWLQRRPDIAAAERRVAAANADIGVAQTAFYPSLTFNGRGWFSIGQRRHLADVAEPVVGLGAVGQFAVVHRRLQSRATARRRGRLRSGRGRLPPDRALGVSGCGRPACRAGFAGVAIGRRNRGDELGATDLEYCQQPLPGGFGDVSGSHHRPKRRAGFATRRRATGRRTARRGRGAGQGAGRRMGLAANCRSTDSCNRQADCNPTQSFRRCNTSSCRRRGHPRSRPCSLNH